MRRAAAGLAHVLYAKSPGGIVASVRRTERWRSEIAAVAPASGIDPDTLEAIVLLESAGRPDAIAGGDLAGAAGLTQIVASTGTGLLGMRIDLAASRRRTRQLARARVRGQRKRAAALSALRSRADPRFYPAKALAATARYLRLSLARFGRTDLAVESYHMGIGNLETALRRYAGDVSTPTARLVSGRGMSYARLYFDSTPLVHPAAWSWLSGLGDDSATYLWRVYAARQVIELARSDPAALAREAALQLERDSAEGVLHPPGEVDGAPAVALPLRALAADGIAVDRGAGTPALRPGALAMLGWIGAQVQRISGLSPLRVTAIDPAGWAVEVARSYVSSAQAQAFQYVLERLTALDLIAWARGPATIRVAVAGDAGAVLAR